ncbi:MAG: transcriptional regulator, Crp/Fnr family [Acidobacteriales bacterium]|nr:transcriptional regulator, Crp/Fnr family [Terriglobales bacterium]
MTAVGMKSAIRPDNGTTVSAAVPLITIKKAVAIGRTRRMKQSVFPVADFLNDAGLGKSILERPKNSTIFSQGDPADAVFYIQKGKVKIAVVSAQGKEATVAVLGVGDFVGEDCIATTHPLRLLTATAQSDCVLLRIGKKEMIRVLSEDHAFSEVFVAFLLARNARSQEDLIDQLFNSSEKRLARVLLQLAQFGKEDQPEIVIPKISQESLAEMVGTTRSRVSFFMNRFRKLGFIEYDGTIKVHSSLLNVVLHE